MGYAVGRGCQYWLPLVGFALLTGPSNAQTLPLSGTWQGSYTCVQGKTGLKLTFEDATSAVGVFDFFAHPSNPAVPSGAFVVRARYTDSKTIVIEPGEWIRRPSGYSTVGMHGQLDKDGATFSGTIDFSGCSTFEVTRLSMAKRTLGAQPQETPAQLVMPLGE